MPLLVLTYLISEEKEKKLKHMMKMMGLKESTYVISWFILYTIISTIISIVAIILLSINVLKHSSAGIIFLFLFEFGLSQFGLMIMAV
jgi:hypothetical protein